jgi:hypothetical protein
MSTGLRVNRQYKPTFVRESDMEYQSPRTDGYQDRTSELPKGYDTRLFSVFDDEVGVNARICVTRPVGEFMSPKHRHTFAQVRYMVSGSMAYGAATVRRGDLIYIPEGVDYGPMRPAENAKNGRPSEEEVKLVDIQFMGPSGVPYHSPDEQERARVALAKVGEFVGARSYLRADGKKMDAWEAVDEFLTGKPTEHLPSRQSDITTIQTESFRWVEYPGVPGMYFKYFGNFSEVGPRLLMFRLDGGVSSFEGVHPWQQVRYLVGGSILSGEERYEPCSFIYCPPDTTYGPVTALSESTFFVMQWSPLGDGRIHPAAVQF